ncbi:protein NETWORKED 1D-like [Hibiscus syriacus]|uniref:protein NETWORKED 1D-like n=1 Tax=Hibiscus syriacus TaxID=106335 RepID=UPI001924077F|nr:protein NETWORKED 1D-like [Hibiscus syriacus]
MKADLSWAQCGSSLFPINRRSILIVLLDREEDAESLRIEVKRLMVKVSELSSALERQEKEHNEINLELCLCKEQMKRETSLKIEASREKASIQQMLDSKSEVISKSNSECSRLEQRNMALAKELAVLKLVTDLDLEQDEMLKLASLGNEGNNQDVVDNLIRSLSCHKKSYKELMAKCHLLGRGEARLQKKLEKAKEKTDKLQKRIQDLETLTEVKDNEVLRALKTSKKTDSKGSVLIVDDNFDSSNAKQQFNITTTKHYDMEKTVSHSKAIKQQNHNAFNTPGMTW